MKSYFLQAALTDKRAQVKILVASRLPVCGSVEGRVSDVTSRQHHFAPL